MSFQKTVYKQRFEETEKAARKHKCEIAQAEKLQADREMVCAYDCQQICKEDYHPYARQVQRLPAAENPDYLELRRITKTG